MTLNKYYLITFFNECFNEIIKKRIYVTVLLLAVVKENIEIIKLLLNNDKINPNIRNISNLDFFTKFACE